MLKIKNTLTKKKEVFTPLKKESVKFYQCGPTLYWNQHIGNLRSVVLADLINRSLKYLGYKVNFVRNYTDVGHLSGDNEDNADNGEDKMEKAVKREKLNVKEITEKYQKKFEQDIKDLNTLLPNHTPKATEYIDEQINIVEILLKKKYAYITDLAIYFNTSMLKNYYIFSKQKKDCCSIGAGIGKIQDTNKKNPNDFVLWFFKAGTHKNAIQTWKAKNFYSPLSKDGEGFPGWHLECSAMAKSILGPTLDLKMGGIEHISIHHTNEIAQSESANNAPYVKYWLHNEHLNINGKKMSKSEGMSILLSDIKNKGFYSLDLRYFFLQAHYRSKQNFTWEALKSSAITLKKLKKKIENLPDGGKISKEFKDKFIDKIKDDFSIPEALSVIWKILKSKLSKADKKATILDFDKILGLKLNQKKKKNILSKELKSLINKREKARKEKKWQEADKIREEIIKKGGFLEDKKIIK